MATSRLSDRSHDTGLSTLSRQDVFGNPLYKGWATDLYQSCSGSGTQIKCGRGQVEKATYLQLTRGLLHCTICCLWWLALFTVHIIIDSKWRRRLFIVCMAALLLRAVWARDTTPHTATATVQQGHYTTDNHCRRTTWTLHYR